MNNFIYILRKRGLVRIAAVFTCSLGLFFSILVFPDAALSEEGGSLDLESITVPKAFGTIKEVYRAHSRGKKSSRIIFHIQDVHVNYEAQKNLANILEYLIETYGLRLVLVEGGITDKDFSDIRGLAPLEDRRRKADELLREGIISGEDYVDIATDFPLKFQGIEEKDLYEENMEAYLKVEVFRREALEFIDKLKDILERLKRSVYTARLKTFDKEKNGYDRNETELVDYIKYLSDMGAKEKIILAPYANHLLLLKTSRLENEINFNNVEAQRDKLMKVLTKRAAKDRIGRLLMMSFKFKEDKISSGEYYSYLRDFSVENGIDIKRYKNLNKYCDYIASYEKLEMEKLFSEVNEIEDALFTALCKNEDQKRLFGISKNLSMLEEFLKLKLSPEDFAYYRSKKNDFIVKGWKGFLKKHADRFKIDLSVLEDSDIIDGNIETLESFYNVAFKRDKGFLRNSLRKMRKEKESIAALIAGGFHTTNLTRLLMNEGISYLVIAPIFSGKTDEELYDRILKESYETRKW